ncbi:MAG: glycosyltransferase [Vulcanibacillus sp.]
MNILVFTIHYPLKNVDSTATKAVHYFTKEWIKQGHRVVVVHNHIKLIDYFNANKKKKNIDSYTIDGVEVLYCPINRYIPKFDYILKSDVRKVKKTVLDFLKSKNFLPDKFVVHFCAEQWQIVEAIRKLLNCTPIPIFHNCDVKSDKRIKKIVTTINKIGYRSEKIRDKILSVVDKNIETFQVFSGAPDYIFEINQSKSKIKKVKEDKKQLIYVGNLIPLKNIDITVKALAEIKDKYNYEFTIIGSGKSEKYLKKLVRVFNIEKRISFFPRKDRNEVLEFMRRSDCFIMVSQPETLGIVYIEAMASGCFVIGSKNEGIDGIIVDKESGLLVHPNEVKSLKEALIYYFELDPYKQEMILKESSNQALKYRESTVSIDYLNNL